MKIKLLILGMIALAFTGCKKFFDADPENLKTVEQMYTDPAFAQGFVTTAYRTIPGYYNDSDLATDDAVASDQNNGFAQIATGSWTATNGALSVWNQSFSAILYLNEFLAQSNKVKWANDAEAGKLLNFRMRGEAFGLRALHMYFLLKNHAGLTPDGKLMGVPIVTEFKGISGVDFNQPRDPFEACLKQIYLDLDSAEYYLPMEYVDIADASQIPAQYAVVTQNPAVYNRAMGQLHRQLFNGLIAKSFRARTALLAASPAFQNPANPATWADAANAAAAVIKYKGGANALPADGFTFYDNRVQIDNLSEGINPSEIIWRENRQTNNSDRESRNFPPTLFGNGLTNPTQNLVDAFPMANGYPIGDEINSGFDKTNPYAGRDPRLKNYILYNGHPDIANFKTGSQSGSIDGINVRSQSTRTGYYMKKTLRWDVNLTPGSSTGRNRYTPRIRYTEIYLDYAEAANEAWGPTGDGGHGFSAYDVIKRIRQRAGVGTTSDPYLDLCKGDPSKMKELIRNERRLELCFEGFRFWDLRRWKANLNETADGMDVNGTVYTPITVESRVFQDHMYYGPIPNSEVLKYPKLIQNADW